MQAELRSLIENLNDKLQKSDFNNKPGSREIRSRVVERVLLPLANFFDSAVQAVISINIDDVMKYALMLYRAYYHELRRTRKHGSSVYCF